MWIHNWSVNWDITKCSAKLSGYKKKQESRNKCQQETEEEADCRVCRVSGAFSTASWIIEGPVVWHWVVSCVICHTGSVGEPLNTHTHTISDRWEACWHYLTIYYSHTLTLQVLQHWCLVCYTVMLDQVKRCANCRLCAYALLCGTMSLCQGIAL